MVKIFVAYPSNPPLIGETIEAAAALSSSVAPAPLHRDIVTWKRPDAAGDLIGPSVIEQLNAADIIAGDVTVPNFNVTYELGFAIGLGKRILPIRNTALDTPIQEIQRIGIYDTLLAAEYSNSQELAGHFRGSDPGRRFATQYPIDVAPLYIVLPPLASEDTIHLLARVKKTRIGRRAFDPEEQARLTVQDAVRSVAASHGVLIPLLGPSMAQHAVHNIRAAFIAGLAHGMGKTTLLLARTDWSVPLDVRDEVTQYETLEQIDTPLQDFADRVIGEQFSSGRATAPTTNFLAQLNLGDPTAENEELHLGEYFLERDEFRDVKDGKANIVVGRKGSGKTAVFVQARDRLHASNAMVVVDLSPEAYQLRQLKDVVLRGLSEGTKEHLLAAFWEYVLLLEVAHKIIDRDKEIHKRNHTFFEPYQRLLAAYNDEPASRLPDFADRLLGLIASISERYAANPGEEVALSAEQITNIVHSVDIVRLRNAVTEYAKLKHGVFVLFDNLDKGWNATGLEPADVIIIRTLVDASRKLERSLKRAEVVFSCVIFLRNDVYELLIGQMPDRGKESRVLVDWNEADLLRYFIRNRLLFNGMDKKASVEELWYSICVPTVDGVESLSYLIDRSMMRPRYLLRLINHCKGHAVNFGKSKIDDADIQEGLSVFSTDIVTQVDLEIRDVLGVDDVLYHFIGEPTEVSVGRARELCSKGVASPEKATAVYSLLLWHGVLGLKSMNGEPLFIYNVNYDLKRLLATLEKGQGEDALLVINPALWPGLDLIPV